jgi:hypothetical protein
MPFPNFPQVREKSSISLGSGAESERMSNGALRTRRMWSTTKAELTICHILTPAQWTTLSAHYGANRDLQDTIIWRETGETYTVRYTDPPQRIKVGGMWEVTFRVLEV